MAETIVIRADASISIGTGHVMRCLALAQVWQDGGGEAVFAVAQSTSALGERLRVEGIEVVYLNVTPGSPGDAAQAVQLSRERNAKWIVVDGYHFHSAYQRAIKNAQLNLLYVDDTGEAGHYFADLILNQNLHASETTYSDREAYTRLLLGTRYAMLRREFNAWRGQNRTIPPVASRILVTMGGSDPHNVTERVIRALASFKNEKLEIQVVVGGSNPKLASLETLALQSSASLQILKDIRNMPELMAWADLGIASAGSSCWEICLLGLPAILIDVAPNQRALAREMESRGAAVHLGEANEIDVEQIAGRIQSLLVAADLRSSMSKRGRELVDGRGAQRVVSALRSGTLHMRPAEEKDSRILWEWANDPVVRAAAFSAASIAWEEHVNWFAAKLNNPDAMILIAEDDKRNPVGQFRVDKIETGEGEVDVSVAAAFRAAGFGSLLIDLASRLVFEKTAVRKLHAYIRPENRASLHAFERAGFANCGTNEIKGHPAIHCVRSNEQESD